jgi:hypothetical protein
MSGAGVNVASRHIGRWWVVLCLLLQCVVAAAQPAAAELRTATGIVFAQQAGGIVRVLQAGAQLSVGDIVGTQKGSFALLIFADGARVALRPESALAIKAFSFQPEQAATDQMAVEVLKGWLRHVSGEIGRRGNQAAFEMKVRDTTIGIRGTDFAVRLCDPLCVADRARPAEGVLPQSGRLGQIVSSATPVQRLREGQFPVNLAIGEAVFLGDVLQTTDTPALIGFNDGTRLVLGPRTSIALRAEEDSNGRRAPRVDLLQGSLRLVTLELPGAQMYGVLVNAGGTVGVAPGAALDAACAAPAPASALACEQGEVLLRRGAAAVLVEEGVQPLQADQPRRLGGTRPGPDAPSLVGSAAQADSLIDPLDVPPESVRPGSVTEPAALGTYVAVFEGLVSVANPLGEVLVGRGQGAFSPLLPTFLPRLLPASPDYMERDRELERARLFPGMCLIR